MRYRKIPVEICAVQWDGSEASYHFLVDWTKGGFRVVTDGIYTAEVYDVLHDTWVKLRTGDVVIQGLSGEFYPCEKAVFDKSYEAA